jgi:hypothetical protein
MERGPKKVFSLYVAILAMAHGYEPLSMGWHRSCMVRNPGYRGSAISSLFLLAHTLLLNEMLMSLIG